MPLTNWLGRNRLFVSNRSGGRHLQVTTVDLADRRNGGQERDS
jgi:hypothetical protein